MPRKCPSLPATLLLMSAALPAAAAQWTVNTLVDAGPGSLRQAILEANAAAGADSIVFSIPGTGPHTIAVQSPLPTITGPTRIDGYTQPGASPNTLATGWDADIRIEIDALAVNSGIGLRAESTAINSEIRGLAIVNLRGVSIQVEADDAVVAGNIVGLRADGVTPNQLGQGFLLDGQGSITAFRANASPSARRIRIGGPAPADRNLVAGVTNGIAANATSFGDPGYTGVEDVMIQNNWIGLDGSGLRVVGVRNGVSLLRTLRANVRDNVMVSPASQLGPFGGQGSGIGVLFSSIETTIQGNRIGVDPTGDGLLSGLIPFGSSNGIEFTNSTVVLALVGDASIPARGNVIAHTQSPGIRIQGGVRRVSMAGNRIFSTGGGAPMAIDLLLPTGPNTNDPLDADSGSNDLQNHPVPTSATAVPGGTRVMGTMSSQPNRSYRIEFHAAATCPSNQRGQAQRPLGATTLVTDPTGEATFDVTTSPAPAGWQVAATATDPDGNTSEFGPCIAIAGDPGPGTLSLSAIRYQPVECGPTVNVVVRRTEGAAGSITVRLRSEGGTATPAADYEAIDTVLTWANGDASDKLVTINVIDDLVPDPGEYFGLRLVDPTGGAALGAISGAVAVIGDDLPQLIFTNGFEPGSPP